MAEVMRSEKEIRKELARHRRAIKRIEDDDGDEDELYVHVEQAEALAWVLKVD